MWPDNGGLININTINPTPLPWSGVYFDGVPITLTAVPEPEFIFVQWLSDGVNIPNNKQQSITVNVDVDTKFTATFGRSDVPAELTVFPNPAGDVVTAGFQMESASEGIIRINDSYGKEVMRIEGVGLNSGPNYYSLQTSWLTSGVYLISLESEEGQKSAKAIIIH